MENHPGKSALQDGTTAAGLAWSEWLVLSGKKFAVSGLSAGLAHVMHHPLYTLKSQMMYYGPDFRWTRFGQRSLREPLGFLYRGVVPRTFGIMPEKAFKMQAWSIVGGWMDRHMENPTISKWIVAGAAAGAATTIIGCPSERAMVLAHIRKQGFIEVVRRTGLRGLYLGVTSTLYRDVSFNAVFFTYREISLRAYTRWYGEDPGAWTRTLHGVIGGCLASVVACPFDVVKTRMQGNELGGAYKSFSHIAWGIVRNEGARHLMKGLLPRLIAVPLYMSVFYVINEELAKVILGQSTV